MQTKNEARIELEAAKLMYYNSTKRNAKGHFVKKVTVLEAQKNGKLQIRNRNTKTYRSVVTNQEFKVFATFSK